jgi:hypothetical protein
LITPLRKLTLKGVLYARRPEVESEIEELLSLSEKELLARCNVRRSGSTGHVSTEAVLHFLRARRGRGDSPAVLQLFAVLTERVLRALPRADNPDGSTVSFSKEQIRERTFDGFTDLLLRDRSAYEDRLDYFEINFNGGLASLRLTAQKRVWRDENRSTTLESTEDEGEIKSEVEDAAGTYDPLSAEALDDARYRSRLDVAIDTLPTLQNRIVEMLRGGIPIDSKDPSIVTIRGVLGKAEKTIRNQRDRAFAHLRVALSGKGKI